MELPGVFATTYKSDMAIVRTKTQWMVVIASLIFVFTLPVYISNYWATWLIGVCVWVIAVLGLHLLTGMCGLFSIAQAALMAVGAFTTGILTSRFGLSAWATLPLSALAAGIVGIGFGMPSLRIKGFYFAMASIAASFLILWVIGYLDQWTGGQDGLLVPRIELAGIDWGEPTNYLYVALILSVLMIVLTKNIQRTTKGRVFVAIRDNDLAAQMMGISLFWNKSLALFVSSLYAGIAGWLWAHYIVVIHPDQFDMITAVWMIGALFIGGMGSTAGAVAGVVGIKLLDVLTDEVVFPALSRAFPESSISILAYAGVFIYAIVLILFILFEPRGLNHRWLAFKFRYRLFPFGY